MAVISSRLLSARVLVFSLISTAVSVDASKGQTSLGDPKVASDGESYAREAAEAAPAEGMYSLNRSLRRGGRGGHALEGVHSVYALEAAECNVPSYVFVAGVDGAAHHGGE